ncbi:MAG: GWxTD domain-containing protein [Bacteroidales bacterium]|nr:GWxTD domain-containing protein [Bacteroidales bacterium]
MYILLLLSLLLLGGCWAFQRDVLSSSNAQRSSASDFSSMYKPSSSVVNPQITAYVSSDSEADVFFRIRTQELKNALANPLEKEINVYVKYYLRTAGDFQLADTASMRYTFDVSSGDYVYGRFKLALAEKVAYKVVIDFVNVRYDIRKRLICDLKNTPVFNDDKFIAKTSSDEVLFSNVVSAGRSLVLSGGADCNKSVDIEFYSEKSYVSLPPYLSSPVKAPNLPDSIFRYTFGDTLHIDKAGLYALGTVSKNEKFGIVATNNQSYPSVTKVADMLEPLKLICTDKEFARLDSSEYLKKSVDAFWLGLSKNEKNAKEQIRVFYSRVALANMLFPSRVEGWQTDRGMLYIMLGPPSIVNITHTSEEWIYGDTNGLLFTFENTSGLRNDYSLLRSNTYQSVWSQVLTTWRSGKIFTVSKLNNE